MVRLIAHFALCLPLAVCPVLCGASPSAAPDSPSEGVLPASCCGHATGHCEDQEQFPADDSRSCCDTCQCVCGGAVVVDVTQIGALTPLGFSAIVSQHRVSDRDLSANHVADNERPGEPLGGHAMRVRLATFLL